MPNITAATAHAAAIADALAELSVIDAVIRSIDENDSDITWGHVGDIANITHKLTEISDQMTGSGEYAV